MGFDRQAAQAQNLQKPPRPDADMTRFDAEQTDYGRLLITRSWSPRHAPSLTYTEVLVIGPRGGTVWSRRQGPS